MTTGVPQPLTLGRKLQQLVKERAAGSIDTDTWEQAFLQLLSQYHLAAYAHGAELSLKQLTPEDHTLIQKVIDRQGEYVNGFKDDWNSGRYDQSDAEALNRAAMYADATTGSWWMGNTRGYPLPAWPCDGTTQCKTKCGCSWEIQPVAGEGNANAFWRLGRANNCQTCQQRSEDWGPLEIRGGDLQLKSYIGIAEKGWVTIHGHPVLIGGSSSAGGGGGAAWKPTMSQSEAQRWNKNSVIQGPQYHFTSQNAAESIANAGFDSNHGKTNQYYGQGIYLAPQATGLKFYGDTGVETRVNVHKVYKYDDTTDLPLAHSKGPLGPEIDALRTKDPTISRAAAVTHVLRSNGYDAVEAIEDGRPILVVFDKTNVTVVKPNDIKAD